MSSTRLQEALARAGDGALDEVYRKERPRLQRYFDWKAGPETSSDLVQDVFLRALRRARAERLDNPAGYLWRIAQNLVVDTVRISNRRAPQVAFDEMQHSPAGADQAAILEAKELQGRYEKALAALPAKTRDVFLMHRIDELTYQEIAAATGMSVAGVEYHMSKALAHLAKRLDIAR